MVDVYSSPITYEGENQLFSIIFDVSDREKFRYDLYWDNELLSVTLNSIGDGVVTTDNEGNITYLNQAAQEITGWNNETAAARPFEKIFDLRNETTGEAISNPVSAVLRTGKIVGLANHTVLLNRQGDFIPITDSAAPIKDQTGHVYGVVMVFHDVSNEKRQQRRIMYLSYHDSLTGIFNRRYMEEEMIRMDKSSMLPITVIMGDVNGLKVTNDVFGKNIPTYHSEKWDHRPMGRGRIPGPAAQYRYRPGSENHTNSGGRIQEKPPPSPADQRVFGI